MLSLYKSSLCDIIINTVSENENNQIHNFCLSMPHMLKYYQNYLEKSDIIWQNIHPIDNYVDYNTLEFNDNLLDKCAVLKLNGGLGTTMGCNGPKALVEIRDNINFLEATIQQLYHYNTENKCNIPLILMNSFNTEDETHEYISKYLNNRINITSFTQNKFLKIDANTCLPIAKSLNVDKNMFYPPGHGDMFQSIKSSGMLDKLLSQGIKYIFISNIDNLGATFDNSILNYMIKHNYDFIMELTNKTINDTKGGTVIRYNNQLNLLEASQVPKDKINEFSAIKLFNTNNIWINLEAIKLLDTNSINLDIIVNHNMYNNTNIIQLETAVGSAIKYFHSCCINVPRTRFMPVKSSIDLFLLRSCFYELKNGYLKKIIDKPLPIINLPDSYKMIDCFEKYIKYIPDISKLNKLYINKGYIKFSNNKSICGDIIIENLNDNDIYEL